MRFPGLLANPFYLPAAKFTAFCLACRETLTHVPDYSQEHNHAVGGFGEQT